MIVGNGLIADAFKRSESDFNDYVIFASGVSNSNETESSKFKREKDLLIKTLSENHGKTIIYFSSILAEVDSAPYYKHKLRMERLIKKSTYRYLIFRIPQIVGFNGNKTNLFNFLQESIKNKESMVIYSQVKRALIDIDHLVHFVNYVAERLDSTIITLSFIEKISVLELCNQIARKLKIEPIVSVKDEHTGPLNNWDIPNSDIVSHWLSSETCPTIRTGYTDNIIDKYVK